MNGELVKPDIQLPAVQTGATTLLSAIAAAASNPAADIDKMERLFLMHQKMVAQEAEAAFNGAMARAQAGIVPVAHNAANTQTNSRYAKLAAINKAITPIYTAEGLSISFDTAECPTPGYLRIIAIVAHAQGHSRQYHLDLPPDSTGAKGTVNKTMVHATGSTNAYARRYLALMIFNVSTEDDTDGQQDKRATPSGGVADRLTSEQCDRVSVVVEKVQEWINSGSIGDAVAETQNANFQADEHVYFWSFFDSKSRAAMKAENERIKAAQKPAPALISDAQKKRLEARIHELKIDREAVKAYAAKRFGKEHFAELDQDQYDILYVHLDSMEKPSPNAAPASPEPSASSRTATGAGAAVGAPTDDAIIENVEKLIDRNKFKSANDLAHTISDTERRENAIVRITKAYEAMP